MTDTQKILGWVLLALHLLFLPYIILLVCRLCSVPLNGSTLNIATFVTAFVLTLGVFLPFLRKNLQIFLADPKKHLLDAWVGFALYYTTSVLVNVLVQIVSPEFSNANDANIAQLSDGYYGAMLFCTVVLVPVTEEVLYRGMLFGLLWHKNRILAYTVSVFVFAAIHVVGYLGQLSPLQILLSLLQYMPAAACLAYAYEKTDSIVTPILIHSVVNLISMLAMR